MLIIHPFLLQVDVKKLFLLYLNIPKKFYEEDLWQAGIYLGCFILFLINVDPSLQKIIFSLVKYWILKEKTEKFQWSLWVHNILYIHTVGTSNQRIFAANRHKVIFDRKDVFPLRLLFKLKFFYSLCWPLGCNISRKIWAVKPG